MPTTKPRVWVTLEPDAYEVLAGMAKLGNTTPGRVLSEIASPVLPALKRLVDAAGEFAAWEKALRDQLGQVHAEVTQGIDLAVEALEARRSAAEASGHEAIPVTLSGGAHGPDSLAGGAVPGGASMPRSAQPGAAPEASPRLRKTPPTNRGVILTRGKQNQQVKKGGPGRGI